MVGECEHNIGLFHDYEGDKLITVAGLKEEQPNSGYAMELCRKHVEKNPEILEMFDIAIVNKKNVSWICA